MIIRRRHTANFTTIGNGLFEDERLAADEVGILAYLLSRPHDWEVRRPALMRRWRIGAKALRRVVNNWMLTGWARAEKVRLPNGTFDIMYVIRDEAGPSLSPDEVRRALSLLCGEVASDESEIGEETADETDQSEAPTTPPSGGGGEFLRERPPPRQPGVADGGMVLLQKNESTKIEREPVGYDRKAAFIAAFEARWPTAASDDRAETAKACRDLPEEMENDALAGIGPYLEARKAAGRKLAPAGAKYLRQRSWELSRRPATDAQVVVSHAADSPEALAIDVIYGLAGKAAAVRSYMRLRDGSICYRLAVTAQLRALATAPAPEQWPVLSCQQAAAWNDVINAYVAIETRKHLREGDRAPWLWPPSKEGKVYAGTGPPETLMSNADVAELENFK